MERHVMNSSSSLHLERQMGRLVSQLAKYQVFRGQQSSEQ